MLILMPICLHTCLHVCLPAYMISVYLDFQKYEFLEIRKFRNTPLSPFIVHSNM